MPREEKIAAIYKEMADKELTFGCRVNTGCGRTVSIVEETADERGYIVVSPESLYGDDDIGAYYIGLRVNGLEAIEEIDIAEIIGHPVMIGDVLDWIEPYGTGCAQSVEISNRKKRKKDLLILQWDNKRTPIEDQSDECIDYVYNLIQKD